MGWAEMLIRLNIPYDTEAAVQLASEVMGFIDLHAKQASRELALTRGAFPNWKQSIYTEAAPLRNATTTSIAPTGTISIIAGTSSSIEPLFALAFFRTQVLQGETLPYIDPLFLETVEKYALPKDKITEQLIERGMAGNIAELPAEIKEVFKTALEIAPEWHLRHQLAFQQHTDNAVSKTINLPESASIQDIDRIFRLAWRKKAKGITIFRNHSKLQQVLNPGLQNINRTCKLSCNPEW